jgi:hypothetical protein
MLQKLRGVWGNWRENSRQYKIDRALYRQARDHDGGFSSSDRASLVDMGSGEHLPEPHTHGLPPPAQRSEALPAPADHASGRAGRSTRADRKQWRIDWSGLVGLLVFGGVFVGLLVLLALTHWTGDLGAR